MVIISTIICKILPKNYPQTSLSGSSASALPPCPWDTGSAVRTPGWGVVFSSWEHRYPASLWRPQKSPASNTPPSTKEAEGQGHRPLLDGVTALRRGGLSPSPSPTVGPEWGGQEGLPYLRRGPLMVGGVGGAHRSGKINQVAQTGP